ncbi:MAG: biotin transporter BioY [Clostridiaceae bacterium]|nr:biotin transporter BioY [Clostridiaceae bacterium]
MFKKLTIRDITYSALFAALIGIGAYISIPLPFTPVPITAQTLVVMLAGGILTTKQGLLSGVVYILLGIIGVPVFAGGSAGIGIIAGPTGGFLLSWPLAMVVISILRGKNNHWIPLGIANLIGGIGVIYILGIPWFISVTAMDLQQSIALAVLPYIPGDLIKVAIATPLALKLNQRISKLVTA